MVVVLSIFALLVEQTGLAHLRLLMEWRPKRKMGSQERDLATVGPRGMAVGAILTKKSILVAKHLLAIRVCLVGRVANVEMAKIDL